MESPRREPTTTTTAVKAGMVSYTCSTKHALTDVQVAMDAVAALKPAATSTPHTHLRDAKGLTVVHHVRLNLAIQSPSSDPLQLVTAFHLQPPLAAPLGKRAKRLQEDGALRESVKE